MSGRPMLIFASDIHLTDALHGQAVTKAELFERFWVRIQAARGKRAAHLCFVGDLFDIVRSPSWMAGKARPYHDPGERVVTQVEEIVDRVLAREKKFFDAIRGRVEAGELVVHYVLGNHDRLLRFAPEARRKINLALTGRDEFIEFPSEMVFPDHKVLAYHGHVGDLLNASPDGSGTIGDVIGCDLITRFPHDVQRVLGEKREELEDIDDVRPIYAVPAWVRQIGIQKRELLTPVAQTWTTLVHDFMDNDFVRRWMQKQSKMFGFDAGTKLKLLLELSTGRIMAKAHDQRLTKLYKVFQHSFDGKMSLRAGEELVRRGGLQYVVNGHSHFANMVPLGRMNGKPAVYFNTGTWRTLHQIGYDVGGRPSFLPFDAMSYLVFFPTGDPMGRDYEWWNGAMVANMVNASV